MGGEGGRTRKGGRRGGKKGGGKDSQEVKVYRHRCISVDVNPRNPTALLLSLPPYITQQS